MVHIRSKLPAGVEVQTMMQANLRNGKQEVFAGSTMSLPIEYRRRHNARRYILRVNETGDGGHVTIPRRGNLEEARAFARRNISWLESRLKQWQEKEAGRDRTRILFRGEAVALTAISDTHVLLGDHRIEIEPDKGGARAGIKKKLWELARSELPARVSELAAEHGLTVKRVSVRDQRSRWGSCSTRGVVSLNWRLIQAPEFVRDYIIVHELMHLREMNHSARFWKLVYEAFPQTEEAERWLRLHSTLLRSAGMD